MTSEQLFDFLTARLKELGWSKPRFAKEVGVSPQLVYKWLDKDPDLRIVPGPASCRKIAATLSVGADYVMELAGHRKNEGTPMAEVDAKRQAVRAQLESWLNAVGPENEPFFWDYIKALGDTGVGLVRHARTAISDPTDAAISPSVSDHPKRGRRPKTNGKGPLSAHQYPVSARLERRLLTAGDRRAA